MRHLQAGGHEHGGHDELHEGEPDVHHDGRGSNHNRNLRIIALFVIMVGSLLGAVPPLLSTRLRAPNTATSSALRAFAGGVILALALIHITTHAVLELSSVQDYPYSGLLMLAGVCFMVFTEHLLRMYYHPSPAADHAHSHGATEKHSHEKDPHAAADVDAPQGHEEEEHHAHSLVLSHCHPTADGISRVAAWMMELGCVFHSIIIGVDLGVTTQFGKLTTLIIALVFHQFIEGISLGAVIAAAGFGKVKAYTMVLVYSITTPVGVAIGIGITSSYDPESRRSILTKGCLDAVSGGLLLYIAIVHLVCPEFCTSRKSPLRQRAVAYLAFALGVAFMAILAKWA